MTLSIRCDTFETLAHVQAEEIWVKVLIICRIITATIHVRELEICYSVDRPRPNQTDEGFGWTARRTEPFHQTDGPEDAVWVGPSHHSSEGYLSGSASGQATPIGRLHPQPSPMWALAPGPSIAEVDCGCNLPVGVACLKHSHEK
jgi:hypothetical protein